MQGLPVGLCLASILSALLLAPRANGAEKTARPADIESPDVYVLVEMIREELELIRFVMGRPRNEQPELDLDGAAPREAFFQALTLFRKAERLRFEHTRVHTKEPALPRGPIGPADVHRVLDAALQCLRRVKDKLGIERPISPMRRDGGTTSTDVFRSAVQANRQLNLLLERRFAPSDVYQQVTLGIGYAFRLLEQFPEPTTIPAAPALEVGKRPSDVYRLLVACFERMRRIAVASGVPILELRTDEERIAAAEPSDVYDIASLLVSELAFLHGRIPEAAPPPEVYYVGRKFPSHVYQRARILERQLIELEERVRERSARLAAPDAH